jgi:hypothetical protein
MKRHGTQEFRTLQRNRLPRESYLQFVEAERLVKEIFRLSDEAKMGPCILICAYLANLEPSDWEAFKNGVSKR